MEIENEKDIRILFAVEGGSRVWRMDSKDSDYDVRFVFYRPLKEYLKIDTPGDVIHRAYDLEGKPHPVEGADLDFVGFDIFKYAKMLHSSNPSTIEWMQSDMLYFGEKPQEFVDCALKYFKPISLYYHYKSMGKQNYLKYLKSGNLVTYKKYLYAMRGIINAKWVSQYKTLPYIEFNETLSRINTGCTTIPLFIIDSLKRIIKLKKEQKEKDIVQNITKIDNYIESALKDDSDAPENKRLVTTLDLNKAIHRILKL